MPCVCAALAARERAAWRGRRARADGFRLRHRRAPQDQLADRGALAAGGRRAELLDAVPRCAGAGRRHRGALGVPRRRVEGAPDALERFGSGGGVRSPPSVPIARAPFRAPRMS
eukprot:1666701-Prymnesium_polylepis.1